jgi:predicted nucleic acid-binding protein
MTAERISLDSNLLIYAADNTAGDRHRLAARLVVACARIDCVLSVQALSEFFHAVTRKGKLARTVAAKQVKDWMSYFPLIAPDGTALGAALDLSVSTKSGFWDGLLLATAEQAGCTLLLSEDMHDGMKFRALRVRNPFAGSALAKDVADLIAERG